MYSNCSMLGGLLVVCGLYTVLWGKSKEMKMMTQLPQPPLQDQYSHSIDMATSAVHTTTCDSNARPISNAPMNNLKENIEH